MPADRTSPLSPSGQQPIILCLALDRHSGHHWHHDHALARRRDVQTYERAIQTMYAAFPTLNQSMPLEVHTRGRVGGALVLMNADNWKVLVLRKSFNELLVSQQAATAHIAEEREAVPSAASTSTIPGPSGASSPNFSTTPSHPPLNRPGKASPTPGNIGPRPILPLPKRRESTTAHDKLPSHRNSGPLRPAADSTRAQRPSTPTEPTVFSITVELLAGTKRVFKNLLLPTTVLDLKAMVRADVGLDMGVQEMRLYALASVDDDLGKRKQTELDLEDERTLHSYGLSDGESMVYIGTAAKKRKKGRSSWVY
ncbi:hypothetical protein CYLTODRAFT_445478 [Cylindrobasidium torrendii FP15055 ss-10]|uniref:Ubiquitin-like domain-containing protein n=1 Tax=Cylindrobasidium torrendii FP15055 ss-10 TaxID=1314674 RepID=A0A0D7B530_9AGAR|nr:hypothetical protein CYLTODRAFT_445478 [Cylindrobasidium torrendii FP15055 ss-10]